MSSISIESKDSKELPEGAEITRKSCNVSVREIENGYILRKSYDIDYTLNGESKYFYTTKEYFSEENPIQIKEDKKAKKKPGDIFKLLED